MAEPVGTHPVVVAHSISKSFLDGDRVTPVLKDVSLSVAPGEVVALEGPSGSGKTTFASIVGCILTPDHGEVTIAGDKADYSDEQALADLRRRHIGFVFQQFHLFPALTALENVIYTMQLKKHESRGARAEAASLLELVGLEGRMKFLPRDLSGGQKQRVAIARALVGSPALLLADEPTANLDSEVGMSVIQMFQRLARERGTALLIITHDPKVRAIVDRVVRIEDGGICS